MSWHVEEQIANITQSMREGCLYLCRTSLLHTSVVPRQSLPFCIALSRSAEVTPRAMGVAELVTASVGTTTASALRSGEVVPPHVVLRLSLFLLKSPFHRSDRFDPACSVLRSRQAMS